MSRQPAAGAILAFILLESSCIKYQAHELNPVRTEQQFRARSLDEAGLADFVHAQTGPAAPAWPPAKLDPETLTWIAYYFNPAFEVARAKFASAEAALTTARQRINPSLSAAGGYNRTPDSISTWSVSPAFTIETAGKRGYRILEAEKLVEAARIAVYESAWQVRGELRRALVAYASAVRREELLRSETALRAEITAIFQKRVELGAASKPELNVARSEQAALELNLRSAAGEVAQGMAAIAEAAGVPLSALAAKPIDMTSFQNPVPPDELPVRQVERAGLLHRADIRRTLLEYEAADARLRLALANQYPNIPLSPAWSFQEGFPAYTLGSVLESLPLFHHNQGPIAEQTAARLQIEAQFKALQARVIGETQAALLQYRAAVEEWLKARDTFLPVQRQREAAVLSSLRAGESDRLDVTQSRLLTLAAQKAGADALSRAQTALGVLEDAMQSPMNSAIPAPRPETTN